MRKAFLGLAAFLVIPCIGSSAEGPGITAGQQSELDGLLEACDATIARLAVGRSVLDFCLF